MRVTVIGLGYVGLPMAALLASRGHDVQGVDNDPAVLAALREGRPPVDEPDLAALIRAAPMGLHAAPVAADAFVIAVPTPLGPGNAPVLGHVMAAGRALAPVLAEGNLVLLESTCPIGATATLGQVLQELRPDLAVLHVAYAPERVLPGRILAELAENDRVVGGLTPEATEAARLFYAGVTRGHVSGTDAATAEMVKLAENAFRDVNVAFANEVSLIAQHHGLDAWEVIRLANRHPRVEILRPGPGVGGHCIAVDPWFLAHGAPAQARLIPAARAVDAAKRADVLARASAICAGGGEVICLGLAFKADVADLRESPALHVASELARRHPGLVRVVEPHLDAAPAGLGAPLIPLEAALASDAALLLLTDHAAFRRIPRAALAGRHVIDTRGAWAAPEEEHP